MPRAGRSVQGLLRDLDRSGIDLESIEVKRPTLDDVFLTLTGRSLRDAESGDQSPDDSGDDPGGPSGDPSGDLSGDLSGDTDQPGRTATAPSDVPEGALQ